MTTSTSVSKSFRNQYHALANETLSKTIRFLMEKTGISEAELARQTKLTQPTLHRLINGKTPDPRASTLLPLATFFNVSMDYLLGYEPYVNSQLKNLLVHVPIISWADAINWKSNTETLNHDNWQDWVLVENVGEHSYSLKIRPSMEPRFPRNTLLIIDPELTPIDGDFMVAHIKGSEEATLREYFCDGLVKQLKPLSTSLPVENFDKNVTCLGILTRSLLNHHEKKSG